MRINQTKHCCCLDSVCSIDNTGHHLQGCQSEMFLWVPISVKIIKLTKATILDYFSVWKPLTSAEQGSLKPLIIGENECVGLFLPNTYPVLNKTTVIVQNVNYVKKKTDFSLVVASATAMLAGLIMYGPRSGWVQGTRDQLEQFVKVRSELGLWSRSYINISAFSIVWTFISTWHFSIINRGRCIAVSVI